MKEKKPVPSLSNGGGKHYQHHSYVCPLALGNKLFWQKE